MPEISVIIPAFNSADYIGEAIRSVLAQTYTNFELIVVDDGSTDATPEIVREFGHEVTYVRQENGGAASARNHGIRIAKGEFIAFLDADDTWEPDKLEKQINLFKDDPGLGMVFTENKLFDEEGEYCDSLDKKNRLMSGDLAQSIFMSSGVATPTVMVRSEVFRKLGTFEESLSQSEDDNMWIRITSNYKGMLIDEPLVRIREHQGRISHDYIKLFDSILQSIDMLKSKYGDAVRKKIEPVLAKKISLVQFDRGYALLDMGDPGKARRSFWESIKARPFHHRSWVFLFWSFVPRGLQDRLKRVRRKVHPNSYRPPKWVRQPKVEE